MTGGSEITAAADSKSSKRKRDGLDPEAEIHTPSKAAKVTSCATPQKSGQAQTSSRGNAAKNSEKYEHGSNGDEQIGGGSSNSNCQRVDNELFHDPDDPQPEDTQAFCEAFWNYELANERPNALHSCALQTWIAIEEGNNCQEAKAKYERGLDEFCKPKEQGKRDEKIDWAAFCARCNSTMLKSTRTISPDQNEQSLADWIKSVSNPSPSARLGRDMYKVAVRMAAETGKSVHEESEKVNRWLGTTTEDPVLYHVPFEALQAMQSIRDARDLLMVECSPGDISRSLDMLTAMERRGWRHVLEDMTSATATHDEEQMRRLRCNNTYRFMRQWETQKLEEQQDVIAKRRQLLTSSNDMDPDELLQRREVNSIHLLQCGYFGRGSFWEASFAQRMAARPADLHNVQGFHATENCHGPFVDGSWNLCRLDGTMIATAKELGEFLVRVVGDGSYWHGMTYDDIKTVMAARVNVADAAVSDLEYNVTISERELRVVERWIRFVQQPEGSPLHTYAVREGHGDEFMRRRDEQERSRLESAIQSLRAQIVQAKDTAKEFREWEAETLEMITKVTTDGDGGA